MLALGLSAWNMIDSQEFKEPRLDTQVVTKFIPALMSLMVDDQVRQLNAKLPPDERESAITIIEHSGNNSYRRLLSQFQSSSFYNLVTCVLCRSPT